MGQRGETAEGGISRLDPGKARLSETWMGGTARGGRSEPVGPRWPPLWSECGGASTLESFERQARVCCPCYGIEPFQRGGGGARDRLLLWRAVGNVTFPST
jgi:hypothetical protein